MANDLTTLPAVKRWLDISSDNDDALLGDLITQVSAFVENVIQRTILTATHVETYRGTGGSRFLLRNWPVQLVTAVEWGETRIDTQVDAVGNASGIATDGRSLILVGQRTPYGRPVRVLTSATALRKVTPLSRISVTVTAGAHAKPLLVTSMV